MCQIKARNKDVQLSAQEIDAIKVTQEIIKRMAENSQKMKTSFLATCAFFCAILGRGIIALNWRTYAAFLLITFIFWVMDARYLQLERKFREHHKAIVSGSISSLSGYGYFPYHVFIFSMDLSDDSDCLFFDCLKQLQCA